MKCPNCNKEMKEGIVSVDAPQTLFRFFTKTVSGLVWLNEKLENFSRWKYIKDRKRLIPVAFKKDDLKRGYICEACGITTIKYKN